MQSVFEEKNISTAVLRVGLPAMLGQLTTLIYNLADTFFVSMAKEPAMIAAVTLCTPILLIIMSIACVFGMGGSSVAARLLGEKKRDSAGKTVVFCVYAIFLSGVITMIIGLLLANPIAVIAGADADTIQYTYDYLKYVFLGAPWIMLANGFVHLFRSIGWIKESTIGLILGNLINIILDYVFIIPMQMGTAGAALATSIGFLCSSIYYIFCIIYQHQKGNSFLMFSPKELRIEIKIMKGVLSIGIPGALITVLMSVSNIVLNNYIAIYGSDAVASYGIAYKIDMIPIMLLVGLSQGITPLLGYCYGAGLKERLSKTMMISIVYGFILGIFFTAGFLLLGNALSALFLHEEHLVLQTGYFLRILCLSAGLLSIINMVTSYFQALGKAIPSLSITLLRNVVLFVPAVIVLNKFWGLDGVISAQPVVELLLAGICTLLYLYEKKKMTKQTIH